MQHSGCGPLSGWNNVPWGMREAAVFQDRTRTIDHLEETYVCTENTTEIRILQKQFDHIHPEHSVDWNRVRSREGRPGLYRSIIRLGPTEPSKNCWESLTLSTSAEKRPSQIAFCASQSTMYPYKDWKFLSSDTSKHRIKSEPSQRAICSIVRSNRGTVPTRAQCTLLYLWNVRQHFGWSWKHDINDQCWRE